MFIEIYLKTFLYVYIFGGIAWRRAMDGGSKGG